MVRTTVAALAAFAAIAVVGAPAATAAPRCSDPAKKYSAQCGGSATTPWNDEAWVSDVNADGSRGRVIGRAPADLSVKERRDYVKVKQDRMDNLRDALGLN